jgi:hypothetical protein
MRSPVPAAFQEEFQSFVYLVDVAAVDGAAFRLPT